MKKWAAAALFAAALASGSAHAQSAFQGFHVGVNAGPAMSSGETNDTFAGRFDQSMTGFVGGGSAGYMFNFADGWLLDLEGTVGYNSSTGNFSGIKFEQGLNYGGAASIGYMITRNNAVYGKLGYEMQDFKASVGSWSSDKSLGGIVLGAGTRWALDGNWSVKAEYLYTLYETTSLGGGVDIKPSTSALRIGVDYRFY